MSRSSMLRAALRYATELHWPIFIVHGVRPDGSCTCGGRCTTTTRDGKIRHRIGKHPRNRRGHNGATDDVEQITSWWTHAPDSNIGLDTFHGLVVDIDGPEAERALRDLERKHGKLPRTVTSRSRPHHRQLFFAVPHELPTTRGYLGPGIDTRGVGGYVVLPPSRHWSGYIYTWLRSPFAHRMAMAPDWLVEALDRAAPLRAVPGQSRRSREQHQVRGGRRRDRSASGDDCHLAFKMLREGASDEEIAEALRRRSDKYSAKGLLGERYIGTTLREVRAIHEARLPVFEITRVRLEYRDPRVGPPPRAERTSLLLDLASIDDGEVIEGHAIHLPSTGYRSPALIATWRACFGDLDANAIVANAWKMGARDRWNTEVAPTLFGRRLRVARRAGRVTYITGAGAR